VTIAAEHVIADLATLLQGQSNQQCTKHLNPSCFSAPL